MALLYPQLTRTEAQEVYRRLPGTGWRGPEPHAPLRTRGRIFRATGAPRASDEHVNEVRSGLRAILTDMAVSPGQYPALSRADAASFDLALSRHLFREMDITPNEASHMGVWRWMTCVVFPEGVRLRWGRADGSVTEERCLGGLHRNAFARLWWRAWRLQQRDMIDPLYLLAELGEDEMVQIMERGAASSYPRLARVLAANVVHGFPDAADAGRMDLLRDVMKRLVRHLTWMTPESLTPVELHEYVRGLVTESARALGKPEPLPVPCEAVGVVAEVHDGVRSVVRRIIEVEASALASGGTAEYDQELTVGATRRYCARLGLLPPEAPVPL